MWSSVNSLRPLYCGQRQAQGQAGLPPLLEGPMMGRGCMGSWSSDLALVPSQPPRAAELSSSSLGPGPPGHLNSVSCAGGESPLKKDDVVCSTHMATVRPGAAAEGHSAGSVKRWGETLGPRGCAQHRALLGAVHHNPPVEPAQPPHSLLPQPHPVGLPCASSTDVSESASLQPHPAPVFAQQSTCCPWESAQTTA